MNPFIRFAIFIPERIPARAAKNGWTLLAEVGFDFLHFGAVQTPLEGQGESLSEWVGGVDDDAPSQDPLLACPWHSIVRRIMDYRLVDWEPLGVWRRAAVCWSKELLRIIVNITGHRAAAWRAEAKEQEFIIPLSD